MADYSVPVTLKKFSNNGPNSVTYTVAASHTATAPHLVIFDRVIPSVNSKTGNETHARFRIRIHRACAVDGVPNGKESIVEFSGRYPSSADANDVDADLAMLGAMLSDADLRQDVTVELLIPGV
jgi:hypothetical protein